MSEADNKENLSNVQNVAKYQVNKRRMIGDYLLGKTQGEGTFGKVKSAVHSITQEKVAIKILEKERIIEVADVERVSREIHILKLIRHKHVIQLYEIIETPKHIFLVMEYADGGELFDYIVQNQKLSEIEASKFFSELISGIEYLHQLQIVHRDLKPENLLLDFKKSIKIIDFGLSNTYKKGEQLKTACGSPCYAAPEQKMIAGQKYDGLMVDVWSCGVILYAALCGCLPFEDQNTSQLYKKILNGEYTLPKFLSQDSQEFLKAILTTDPKKRITVEQMKVHPWFNLFKRENKISPGIIIGYNRIPIDEKIVRQLEDKGFNPDYTMKCLDANKHNNVTTAYNNNNNILLIRYFLLLKRQTIEGCISKADINNDGFDVGLLEPKKRPEKPPISGLVTSTMLQLQKKVRSGSYQLDNQINSGQNMKSMEQQPQPPHQRGRSVPQVNEVIDERLFVQNLQNNPQYSLKNAYNQLQAVNKKSDPIHQLQSYQSILKEDQQNQFMRNVKNKAKQEQSVSPTLKKKSIPFYPYNRSKKSVSISTNPNNTRPISSSKNQSTHTQSRRTANKNNTSLDQCYQSKLIDTTNAQPKKPQYKLMLNDFHDNFTSNTLLSNGGGNRYIYPPTTVPQSQNKNKVPFDQNISISKLTQLCKRRDTSGSRKSDSVNKKINQSFTSSNQRGFVLY